MAKYKCPTLGDCDKANSGEIFERAPGEELKCPACGTLLDPVATPGGSGGGGGGGSKTLLIAAGAAAVLILAGGGYYFTAKPAKAPEPPPITQEAAAPAPAPAPAPVAAPATNSGIPPSEAETQKLREESQAKLVSGEAASAEQAGSKAAANEMLKLAIAKMAQGKLEDAEKDLLEARARDPKQSLVSYNLAILRLKQGRKDDALKEFEASFMAGFNYFDKMDQDTDLDALRKDSRFTDLVAQYRNKPTK
ncbi:tetratricopeptide repeat protein [Zoogloea sp.]|uniref:tetratricopeptide repeat protein n=1 Tax=Zoogloea sp. TaxID=49181 RepID=UPI002590B25D|nr:tetratricopeptide repeat protein [Zoogloea sp.]MDD2669990.1 tetratricopeptide repeat protein [Zoogloea sp.]